MKSLCRKGAIRMLENYCADLLRNHDYERYVMVLFADKARRPALFALYALHYEIARIPWAVNEKMLGLIRLQWWRDTVKTALTEKPAPHDIIRALHAARQDGVCWTEDEIIALIDAYEPLVEESAHNAESLVSIAKGIAAALAILQQRAWTLEKTAQGTGQAGLVQAQENDLEIICADTLLRYLKTLSADKIKLQGGIESVIHNAHLLLQAKAVSHPVRLMRGITKINLKALDKNGNNISAPAFRAADPLLAFKLWIKSWANPFATKA